MASERTQQSRAKKFAKDFAIYAVGNIGSKLITFLMMPLYTFFIKDHSDLGYYDVCFNITLLMLIFTTLQLRDGTFRFLLDAPNDITRKRVITFVNKALIATLIFSTLLFALIYFTHTMGYMWHVLGLLISMSLYEVAPQIARGLGHNKLFVACGIMSSFGIAALSIVFVCWLGWGIAGIFLANIIARLVPLLMLEIKLKIVRHYFRPGLAIQEQGKEILRFCLPLIPCALCWWLTGNSDRFYIKHFLGLEVNGIYAVAVRFMGLMIVLSSIFYQAWQETAITQYHSNDRDHFFSKMLNGYIYTFSAILVGYMFMLKMCYGFLVESSYQGSIMFVYPLGIAVLMLSIVQFFDMGYQCAKDTKSILPSITVASIINIIINFLLIVPLGVYGMIVSSIITYTFLFFYRWHDMKRYMHLSLSRIVWVPACLLAVSGGTFYLNQALWQDALTLMTIEALFFAFFPATERDKVVHFIKNKLAHKQQ